MPVYNKWSVQSPYEHWNLYDTIPLETPTMTSDFLYKKYIRIKAKEKQTL